VNRSGKRPDHVITTCQDGSAPTREAAMRAQALAHEFNIDRVDLEALDRFLRSDRSPPDSMLSELDGFLTGIAIGPELTRPSEWLPLIWGGDAPAFADLDEANALLGSLMARYNEILRQVADDALAPIFWTDRNGTIITVDWAEGFLQAIKLRADAWEQLFTSNRDGKLLLPILSLCRDKNGQSLLGLPPEANDRLVAQTVEFIPGCVIAIAAYWRRRGPRPISMLLKPHLTADRTVPGPKQAATIRVPAAGQKVQKCSGQTA
jgi:uncharacterized protein